MKKAFYLTAGIIFLILGIIGLALPIIPQIPFLFLAVIFLSRGSARIHNWISSTSLYKKIISRLPDRIAGRIEGKPEPPALPENPEASENSDPESEQ